MHKQRIACLIQFDILVIHVGDIYGDICWVTCMEISMPNWTTKSRVKAYHL